MKLRILLIASLLFVAAAVYAVSKEKPSSPSSQTAKEKTNTTPRVGIQAGHWKLEELPEDEFPDTRVNGGGATYGDYAEWEITLPIAEQVKLLLERQGILVDLIPTTVPMDYLADAFVSIHADGNEDEITGGYKVADAANDQTGKAGQLSSAIERAYSKATGMLVDPLITESMTNYYAFNSGRFDHAISTYTPGVIVETGFLTSAADRSIIVDRPELAAQGIANGILEYLSRP